MVDLKKGRILSAHGDDGPGRGMKVEGAQDLAYGLEFIISAQFTADLLAMISSKGKGPNGFGRIGFKYLLKYFKDSLLYPAQMPPVRGFIEDLLFLCKLFAGNKIVFYRHFLLLLK